MKNYITMWDRSLDEAVIFRSAKDAMIHDDIMRCERGYESELQDGGGDLSGGQRQRLIIARAIIGRPDVLFFDATTSALDNIPQKIVADSLNTLQCTRVVIAHRLSTVKNCDRIIMLDGGHIVEDGTYDEQMAMNGRFAELVKRQQV